MVKLSIIVPVYNVEKYIRHCLDSIYSQKTNEDIFEVIVVDDGTPDKSMAIVEEFAARHQNIVIVHQSNQGLSVARNSGLRIAKGEYVWFVDSDDWLTPGSLSTVITYILSSKYDVISSYLIYAYDQKANNHTKSLNNNLILTPAEYLVSYPVGASQRYILRKSFLTDNNLFFYPGIYHEDADFGGRMLIKTKNILFIKEHLYFYYQREGGSIMSSWRAKNTKDYLFVYKRFLEQSKSIENTYLKTSLLYYSFLILLSAFPYKHVQANPEVKEMYESSKNTIRRFALKLIVYKFPIKKRLRLFLSIINPMLAINRSL